MTHRGTGQHRLTTKRELSEEIERQTREFLNQGGKVKELAPEQERPIRQPEFNRDPEDWGKQSAA